MERCSIHTVSPASPSVIPAFPSVIPAKAGIQSGMFIGGAIGVVAALALGRGAASLLYELDGGDPIVLGSALALLALIALFAGFLPALRASRVAPIVALRYE